MFNGVFTQLLPNSNSGHWKTSLGNWKNTPIAVGGYQPADISPEIYYIKIEHFENGFWVEKGDFPLVDWRIVSYSMATLNENLFLFGKKMFFFLNQKGPSQNKKAHR